MVANMLNGASDMRFKNEWQCLSLDIYPPWSCFVQTIDEPHDEKGLHSTKMQESARKDIER
jgi:hypothetical protein